MYYEFSDYRHIIKIVEVNKMIELRGHHLICRLGFRGMGYDEKFTKKMTQVVEILKNEPNTIIKIAGSTDDLCGSCPNKKNDRCFTGEKYDAEEQIQSMDDVVIKSLSLIVGENYTVSEINELTKEKFSISDFDKMCEGCSWRSYGYCEQGLKEIIY